MSTEAKELTKEEIYDELNRKTDGSISHKNLALKAMSEYAAQEVAKEREKNKAEIERLKEYLRKAKAWANYNDWLKQNYQYNDYDMKYYKWSQQTGLVPFSIGMTEEELRKTYIKENNL